MPRLIKRRPRPIPLELPKVELQTLYIVRATTTKGKLLGYVGRKIIDSEPYNITDAMRVWDLSRTTYHSWRFDYILVDDIISPEHKFLHDTKNEQVRKQQRKALIKYLKQREIEPEDAHRCTLKYYRRSDARKLIQLLPRKKRQYQVVKIQLVYGQPHTARLLSN